MIQLSVVIPCRNTARHVEQIEALARQEWAQPWELIVADNGSTDGTSAMIERYRPRLPQLTVLDAGGRRGAAHARNTGARAARGELLAFCDADDEVAPGWLEAIATAVDRHGFAASRFDIATLNPDPLQQYGGNPQRDGVQRLWYPPYLPHAGASGLGIRRELHERVGGFDEDLIAVEDTDYCLRVQLAGTELHFAADAVIAVRRRATYRGIFRQARVLAACNVVLSKRYRGTGHAPRRRWPTYARQCQGALRQLARARDRRSRGRATYQLGWLLGLLGGSLRHGVPPPVVTDTPPAGSEARLERAR